jgi:hypothetical protein
MFVLNKSITGEGVKLQLFVDHGAGFPIWVGTALVETRWHAGELCLSSKCVPAVDSSCSLQGIQFTCVLHNRGFGTPPLEGVPARWLVTKSPREFGFTCDVLLTEDSRTPTKKEGAGQGHQPGSP